ncbi:MAG: hypothetical protein M3144_03165, partial [Actinomycetota bacterium]|nr:hypothetical protein [Actinomycetota bacterium]
IGPAVAEAVPDLLDAGRDGGWETWAYVGLAVAGVIVAVAAWFVVRAAYLLLLGVPDLFTKTEVEGLVIRLRGGYVAVDDARQRRVRAWRVQPAKLTGIARGDVVRVTVSPRLGHVFKIEAIDRRPHQAGLGAAPVDLPDAADAPAAHPGIDLAALEARTGVRLQVPTGAVVPAFPGADRAFLLSDGGTGTVLVIVSSDDRGNATSGLTTFLLGWAARRDSRPVDDVGEEASWGDRRNVLTARRGGKRVTVMVGLEDLGPDRRLDVAKALADALL